jgi:pimeloyl-ACP methyl ester carboxylesterase
MILNIELYYEMHGEGEPIIFSHGCMMALTFALNHLDKVSKLVLVGTSAKMSFSGRIQLWNMLHFLSYECFTEFMKNYDIRDRIYEIKVPTLIIVGEKDTATPVEMSQDLNRGIKGSKLQIIPDCNHMVMIDKPNELNGIIEEFIK